MKENAILKLSFERQLNIEKWRIFFDTVKVIFDRAGARNSKMPPIIMEKVNDISLRIIPDLGEHNRNTILDEIFGTIEMDASVGPISIKITRNIRENHLENISRALKHINTQLLNKQNDFNVNVIENGVSNLNAITSAAPWCQKDYAPDFILKLIPA